MALDPTLLNKPIDTDDPVFAPVLERLQGNILKGHGRDFTRHLFISFDGADRDAVVSAIREIGSGVLSAAAQLGQVATFRAKGIRGDTATFFFLSASGYEWLGLQPPGDPAFQAGMKNRGRLLADPPADHWWEHFQATIHALLIAGDDDIDALGNAVIPFETMLAKAGAHILGEDAGTALRRDFGSTPAGEKNPGIEHFGYIDGRSQPLMLTDDVAKEAKANGIDPYDPSVGPGVAALVPDPHGGEDAYGSYLVYRRLEQHVRAFKTREGGFKLPDPRPANLADALGLSDEERERAGALVVGRFEDGTSVQRLPDSEKPLPPLPNNNFVYDDGMSGSKCPLHAHIRKSNPRQNQPERLMPRRGIPFGERDPESFEDPTTMPEGGVGLLFIAYNQDIGRQFEFVQSSWINDPGFPVGPGDFDGVMGLGPVVEQGWPPSWDGKARVPFAFGGFVEMTGGEYFFAPSLPFLRTLT